MINLTSSFSASARCRVHLRSRILSAQSNHVHIPYIHMYVYTLHCFDMKQTCVKYELDVDVAEFSLYSFQNFTCSMSRGRYYPGQISQLAQALLPSPLGAHHRYLIKIIIIIIIIIRVIIIIIIIIIGI